MEVDRSVVNYISTTLYNILPIEQSIKQLWGYDDRNFSLVDSSDHQTYILKITNERESKQELADIVDEILDSAHSYFSSLRSTEFVVPKLMRTSANKLSTLVGINVRNTITGDLELKHCNVKLFEFFDGITLYDYVQSKGSNLDALAETYLRVGRLSGQLFDFLHTQNHLIEQLRKCRQKFTWQLATCESFLREWLTELSLADAERSLLVKEVLDEYRAVEQKLKALPQFVVHSDLSLRNMLLGKNSMCLVDFGDAQVGNQLTDLAVAMLYGVLEQESDFRESLRRIPAQILRGYRLANKSSICKLNEEDLDLALTLMKLRLCQSLANAYAASLRDPGNSCTTTTLKNGWTLLEILVRDAQYSKPSMMAKLWRDASSS